MAYAMRCVISSSKGLTNPGRNIQITGFLAVKTTLVNSLNLSGYLKELKLVRHN